MKCTACGYEHDNEKPEEYKIEKKLGNGTIMTETHLQNGKPFIELRNVARPPFGYVNNNGTAIMTGEPACLFACPNCGTVKMDIGC